MRLTIRVSGTITQNGVGSGTGPGGTFEVKQNEYAMVNMMSLDPRDPCTLDDENDISYICMNANGVNNNDTTISNYYGMVGPGTYHINNTEDTVTTLSFVVMMNQN